MDAARTYILYYPNTKDHTLSLLHQLPSVITSTFSPQSVQHYIKNGDITVPGYPKVDASIQTYTKLSPHFYTVNMKHVNTIVCFSGAF